jgi:hypothetical protein
MKVRVDISMGKFQIGDIVDVPGEVGVSWTTAFLAEELPLETPTTVSLNDSEKRALLLGLRRA